LLENVKQKKTKKTFMPRMSRDDQEKFLSKMPAPLSSQPSLFFSGCELPSLTTRELKDSFGEPTKTFEETIREE